MTEKLTQLGLSGFGRETKQQFAEHTSETLENKIQEKLPNLEVGRELMVVPAKTTFYRQNQPDRGFTSLKAFYVSQRADLKTGGRFADVRVEEDGVRVYHDQEYFTLEKGEILEAPRRRLIKK